MYLYALDEKQLNYDAKLLLTDLDEGFLFIVLSEQLRITNKRVWVNNELFIYLFGSLKCKYIGVHISTTHRQLPSLQSEPRIVKC